MASIDEDFGNFPDRTIAEHPYDSLIEGHSNSRSNPHRNPFQNNFESANPNSDAFMRTKNERSIGLAEKYYERYYSWLETRLVLQVNEDDLSVYDGMWMRFSSR